MTKKIRLSVVAFAVAIVSVLGFSNTQLNASTTVNTQTTQKVTLTDMSNIDRLINILQEGNTNTSVASNIKTFLMTSKNRVVMQIRLRGLLNTNATTSYKKSVAFLIARTGNVSQMQYIWTQARSNMDVITNNTYDNTAMKLVNNLLK